MLGVLGVLLAGLFWSVCTFHDLAYRPYGDWDQYLTFFEIQRHSILEEGHYPDWNPWLLGGIPGAAHPQFNSASPFFLPLLLFDLLPGTAVYFGVHATLGMLGTYVLARALGRRPVVAFAAAACFGFCFAPFVSGGVVNRMSGSLLPWYWWSLVLAGNRPRAWLVQALLIGLMLLEGGFYAVLGAGLSAGLLGAFAGGPRAVFGHWLRAGAALLLGIALSAVRFLPTLFLYLEYPRRTEGYEAGAVWRGGALWPPAEALATLRGAGSELFAALFALFQSAFHDIRPVLFEQPVFVGLDLGLLVGGVLLTALFLGARRWLLWLAASFFAVLSLGAASPLDLWSLLKRVPGLWSFDLPMSLVFLALLPLALLFAETLGRWVGLLLPRSGELGGALVVVGAVLIGVIVPLGLQQWPLVSSRPAVELPAAWRTEFHQENGVRMRMLPSVLQGRGVIDAYEEVIRTRLVVGASAELPAWYTLEGTSGGPSPQGASVRQDAELLEWEAGRARWRLDRPIGTLVLNQNFAEGWTARWVDQEPGSVPPESAARAAPLAVSNHEGRVAVELPAGARGVVELRYTPRSRIVGQWISASALLLLMVLASPLGRRLHRSAVRGDRLRARLGGGSPEFAGALASGERTTETETKERSDAVERTEPSP